MSYTSNPFVPKARMQARNDVVWGRLRVMQAARKYGVNRTTIWRWIKQVKQRRLMGNDFLWTLPPIPNHHPNEIKPQVIKRIIKLRAELRGRCAKVIHKHLLDEDISISLSSVERILRREGLTRKRRVAGRPKPIARPLVQAPGDLVQMDTIHLVRGNYTRYYIYTVIDIYSRLAYAECHDNLLQSTSFKVVLRARQKFGFPFKMMQTDNGPEFKTGFGLALARIAVQLRHSRPRKPNDNAHIERFNRTLQDECFLGKYPNEQTIHQDLHDYLNYYNKKRFHLALNLQTPAEYVAKVLN